MEENDKNIFKLMRDDITLGTLRIYGSDMPWWICKFTPTEAFSEVAPAFAKEIKELGKGKEGQWRQAFAEVQALGLKLVPHERGLKINSFIVHIDGEQASLRYSTEQ